MNFIGKHRVNRHHRRSSGCNNLPSFTLAAALLLQFPLSSRGEVVLDGIQMYSSIGTFVRINSTESCPICSTGSHKEYHLTGPYQSTVDINTGPGTYADPTYGLGTLSLSSYASYSASANISQTNSGSVLVSSTINFRNGSNSIRYTGTDTQIVEYVRFDVINQPANVSTRVAGYRFNYIDPMSGEWTSSPEGMPSFEIFTGSVLGSGTSRGPLATSMTLPVGSYYARWSRNSVSGSRLTANQNLPPGTNFAWASEETGTYDLVFSDASTRAGSSPTNPILPAPNANSTGPGRLTGVVHVGDSRWYDPAVAAGFDFVSNNSTRFAAITGFPTGFQDPFEVLVNGVSLGHFKPGQSLSFTDLLGTPVSAFSIRGINPGVDPSSPTSFPIAMSFDKENVDFNMVAADISAVPELPTAGLFALGALALGRWRRTNRRDSLVVPKNPTDT